MGIIKSGILGGFKNKVGPVVGSSWKGISVMRGMPESVANPNTVAQQVQRTKFSRVSKFASQLLTSVIKPYWDSDAKKMSGYNAFVQRNIDAFAVDNEPAMEAILMTRGRLAPTEIKNTSMLSENNVQIAWDGASVGLGQSSMDIAHAVVTDTQGNVLGVSTADEFRDNSLLEVTLPLEYKPIQSVYVFLFFTSADSKSVSDSTVLLLTAS